MKSRRGIIRSVAIALILGVGVFLFPSEAEALDKLEIQSTVDVDSLGAEGPSCTSFDGSEVISVPEDALVVVGDTYYGVKKDWFESVNPDKGAVELSIALPSTVKKVSSDAFRDSYSSDKNKFGALTSYDGLGGYSVVSIDFSQAVNLEVIGSQAAMRAPLSGVLDLSACTKLKVIEKSAFKECASLTGVILPDSIEVLGSSDGSSGSVFYGCLGLNFVRTVSSDEDARFELPGSLKIIGKQTFAASFAEGADLIVRIPSSVETIGSEAFYVQRDSGKARISQIFIERETDFEGYDSGAFKAASTGERLLIMPDYEAYNVTESFTRVTKTYPVTLSFKDVDGTNIEEQSKLFGQSIRYEFDSASARWVVNEEYELPSIPDGSITPVPGYDAGWQVVGDDSVLTASSKVTGKAVDSLEVMPTNMGVVSQPDVAYTVNGDVVSDSGSIPSLEVSITSEQPGSVGVKVTHPLATEEAVESGTYVYFRYCWWDESADGDGVNGPRSISEPELFSSSVDGRLDRVKTENAEIPIRSEADSRQDGSYYLVEIYGYFVKDGGKPKQFYKSNHNFIGYGQDGNADKAYLMNVEAIDKTPVQLPVPDADFEATGYSEGVLSGLEIGMEYSVDGGITWITASQEACSLDGVTPEKDLRVRRVGDGVNTITSDAQIIDVTRIKDESPRVEAIDCSASNASDGRIVGVDDSMEWRAKDANAWTPVDAGSIEDLVPGVYLVRYRAQGLALASSTSELNVSVTQDSDTDSGEPDGQKPGVPNHPDISEGGLPATGDVSGALFAMAWSVGAFGCAGLAQAMRNKRG